MLITILGVIAIIGLLANIYFCVKSLKKQLASESFDWSSLTHAVGIPGLVWLALISQGLFIIN